MIIYHLILAVTCTFSVVWPSPEQLEPQNAVSLYVANTDLSQWSTVDEAFRTELASRTETFCSQSLEDCNINTNTSISISRDDVMYFTGFPAEIENNLRVIFGVGIPPDQAISPPAFVPQSQLASIVLINQMSLQSAAGNLIGLVSLYTQEAPSPTPTAAPEPSLAAAIENAILIIVTQASLEDWQEGNLEELFREAVAVVANDHCTTSPASCNIDSERINTNRRRRSNDAIFDETSTYIIPDFPKPIGSSQMEIAFAVTIPFSVTLTSDTSNYFIPQSTLLSLGLELSPLLAESTGAYIIGISAYRPVKEGRATSPWPLVVGVTIPSLILTLLLLGIPTGIVVFWWRRKRHKETYDVHNYVEGVGKEVEMVRHSHLRGVYSPVRSEVSQDPQLTQDELEDEDDDREEVVGGGNSGQEIYQARYDTEGDRFEMQYYSSQDMLRTPVTESETTFSNPRGLSLS